MVVGTKAARSSTTRSKTLEEVHSHSEALVRKASEALARLRKRASRKTKTDPSNNRHAAPAAPVPAPQQEETTTMTHEDAVPTTQPASPAPSRIPNARNEPQGLVKRMRALYESKSMSNIPDVVPLQRGGMGGWCASCCG